MGESELQLAGIGGDEMRLIDGILATPLFLFGWFLFTSRLRDLTYAYAFHGMRMEEAKKVYQAQSRRDKMTIFYLRDCNVTPYQARSRVTWCILCQSIYTVNTIFFILMLWIEILSDFRFVLFMPAVYVFALMPVVAFFGLKLFPLEIPWEKDVINAKAHAKMRRKNKPFIMFPKFFRDYKADGDEE